MYSIEKNTVLSSPSVVIDASISGTPNLLDLLAKHIAEGRQIILTSVTIRELDQMQKFSDFDAKNARSILANATEDTKGNYVPTLIVENQSCPDDDIVQFCIDNKEKVTLLTSDKVMVLKAKMYGVNVSYLKPEMHYEIVNTDSNLRTLYGTKMVDGNLCAACASSVYRKISVFRGEEESTDSYCILQVGDDVYNINQKDKGFVFSHHRMVNLDSVNNCELIFSTFMYDLHDIEKLPDEHYKKFVGKFFE